MSIIIVGSNHDNTASYYKKLNMLPSHLITGIDHNHMIGHTSIHDIPDYQTLEIVLSRAKEVYWAECKKEEFHNDEWYYSFLNWLKDFNLKYKTVQNLNQICFDVYNWGKLIPLDPNQIVFLGCSLTAGVGVTDKNTLYSNIVAKHFNLDSLNLAQGGGSNSLIFDRFNRLQFNPGQMIVVQFTTPDRLQYCDMHKKLLPLVFSSSTIEKNFHRSLLEIYHSDFLFYELLCKIRSMVKLARAQQIKLVFWLIDYKNENNYSNLQQTYFYEMIEFVPASWMAGYMVDRAEDKIHPGIESNKNIANTLIKYITTVYEI
jgi:hypothetical protein